MDKTTEMEKMDIPKLGMKMSIPMVISMVSIALYEIVDAMFISQISGDALTTISLSLPIIAIIVAISLGTSIGINALLAKTLGEKNDKKAKKIISTGFRLLLISWTLIAVISLIGVKPFFSFFTANKIVKRLGYTYLSIISILSIGSIFQILFEKILEAYGKTKSSMIVQFSGAVINLILDPILIFGVGIIPALGIKGAAISTVIGQCFGMVLGFAIILKNRIITVKEIIELKLDKSITKEIYKVGFPTIIMEALNSFITLFLNKILISFSDSAVSVWGIYNQLQKFVIIIVYGLNNGMIPIVAYNWGAKKKERVKECISFFLKVGLVVVLFGEVIFLFFPEQIISIYDVTSEVLAIGKDAFRILSLGFIFAGISLVLSSTFQAFGNGTYSLIINLSRKIVFVLPLILILKPFIGIYSVWLSFTIAEVITMIIAIVLFRNIKNNIIEKI